METPCHASLNRHLRPPVPQAIRIIQEFQRDERVRVGDGADQEPGGDGVEEGEPEEVGEGDKAGDGVGVDE